MVPCLASSGEVFAVVENKAVRVFIQPAFRSGSCGLNIVTLTILPCLHFSSSGKLSDSCTFDCRVRFLPHLSGIVNYSSISAIDAVMCIPQPVYVNMISLSQAILPLKLLLCSEMNPLGMVVPNKRTFFY